MASTYIYRTLGTPTNANKGTVSHWIKRSAIGASTQYGTFASFNNGGSATDRGHCNIYDDTIYFYNQQTSTVLQTNRKFRDTNAWYHIVIAWDTTQATASNRVKIYVNGEQETSFSTATYPAQNNTMEFNVSGRRFCVGALGSSGSAAEFWNGSISHFHFCDGYTYQASDFGSQDATTGEWKINTSPNVSYGNNGFFWLKDNIATTDNSPNSNTFTVGAGTLTKTEDCPSNVFCTIGNNLFANKGTKTVGNGGTTITASSSSNWDSVMGNLGASTGKYYFEMKITDTYNNEHNIFIGIVDVETVNQITSQSDNKFANTSGGYGYRGSGAKVHNSTQTNSWGNAWSTNDIIGCAMDLDNSKIYFSINGTWQSSGDPTSGSTGTGAAYTLTSGKFYVPATSMYYTQDDVAFNFGNGYFGTTAVSSAGTNASGIGIFEYDVPANFTALSTKGLNL